MNTSSRKNYLQFIKPFEKLRTKKVLQNNPTSVPIRTGNHESIFTLYSYQHDNCTLRKQIPLSEIGISLFRSPDYYWLNVDFLNAENIEFLGHQVGIHPLIIEDILNKNQRPKLEEIDGLITCLMHMLYYNPETNSIESEQVSFVLGPNFLISFQDDGHRDLFDPVREKLMIARSRLRSQKCDYLLYSLIDAITDQYFVVLDRLAQQIEKLEEEITRGASGAYSMNQINDIRKELMFFKRFVSPVREMTGSIIRSESEWIDEKNHKYFRDIYDHIIQANDLCETYRDVISNLRDLYLSHVNIRTNEVMKFLAIVTALLAPATVIGGVFGMNFDRIPYLHNQNGFWLATSLMLFIPLIMLYYFKKKDWF